MYGGQITIKSIKQKVRRVTKAAVLLLAIESSTHDGFLKEVLCLMRHSTR